MPRKDKRFVYLRKIFPMFSYDKHEWKVKGQKVFLSFKFSVGDFSFNPKSNIKFPKGIDLSKLSSAKKALIENLVFNIGMVEMISYWKATCSPKIRIHKYHLSKAQQNWWRKLFYHGLGEFLYLNKINVNEEDLLSFEFKSKEKLKPSIKQKLKTRSLIIPIGGGKDSLTSVEVLKAHKGQKYFLIMNPTKASKDSAKAASEKFNEQAIVIDRKIDKNLLTLNAKGFLNGHTPFSAMLAFYCSLSSAISGAKYSVLSNESSANEPTILGTNINHQYSKSYEFEKDFNRYLDKYVSTEIEYLSLLRPLNEFQIVNIFSSNPKNFKIFKSCNVGSKQDKWCCDCSKCLFVFILLSAKVGMSKCAEIFGENLLDKKSLKHTFEELIGRSKTKPFECIGTIDEVNVAITLIWEQEENLSMDLYLLKHYKRKFSDAFANKKEINKTRNQFDRKHRLPNFLEKYLKEAHAKAN